LLQGYVFALTNFAATTERPRLPLDVIEAENATSLLNVSPEFSKVAHSRRTPVLRLMLASS
jgi:hypothetical protein